MKKRLSVCAAVLLATTSFAAGRNDHDFRYPRGDAGATRYSPLTQINARNVGRLKQVWRYDLKPDSELQNTPIVVDGVLYGVGSGKVVAQSGLASSINMMGMPSSTAYTRRQA